MIDKSNRARAKNSKKTLKRLLSYFKGYRLKVAIVIFAAIFSAFANVFGTYYLSIVIDTAVAFDNYVDLINTLWHNSITLIKGVILNDINTKCIFAIWR